MSRRQRGVVLTDRGKQRLEAAIASAQDQEKYGARFTQTELEDRAGLSIKTIKKILDQRVPIDETSVRTLFEAFEAFGLELEPADYGQPEPATLPASPESIARRQPSNPKIDWGEKPDTALFFGRTAELATLKQWVQSDQCRLITLLGMGGIGKTSLAAKLANQVYDRFDYVIWRSLREAPPLDEILVRLIQFLSDQQETEINLPTRLGERIIRLLHYLREQRCLVVLDNLESILQAETAGHYRDGYEGYGELIQRIGSTEHQSCLLLTSRECPRELAPLAGDLTPVRLWSVGSIDTEAGREILKTKGLALDEADDQGQELIRRCSGNPQALHLVATAIQREFLGDVDDFLQEQVTAVEDVRSLLDQHLSRLAPLERSVLFWLAINREPVGLDELMEDLLPPVTKQEVRGALRGLSDRYLIETVGKQFTLQNVIMEFTTDRFVEQVSRELKTQEFDLFHTHPLIKAIAKDYIRETQIRLILKPVVNGIRNFEKQIDRLLKTIQQNPDWQTGYASGSLLNLLSQTKSEFSGINFSKLTLRQAYLKGIRIYDLNLEDANLIHSSFTQTLSRTSIVTFNTDGKVLASGDGDGNVHLWSIKNQQPLAILKGHTNEIWSLAFSPDGQILASGSVDSTIRLWNIQSFQEFHIFEGHKRRIRSIDFSPDGQILASGSIDYTVRLWDVQERKCLHILEGHTDRVWSVSFSPNGQFIASGSSDSKICLWDVQKRQCSHIFRGHTGRVRSVKFSPDGNFLASGSKDSTIRLWDVQKRQCSHIFRGHTSQVWSVDFSPDSKLLISGSSDSTIRLWDIQNCKCLHVFKGHIHPVWSVAFSPNGEVIASGSSDSTIRLWDIQKYQSLHEFKGYTNQVWSVAFSPNYPILASGSSDCKVRIWDIEKSRCLCILEGHAEQIWSVAFSPNGKHLISSSSDHTIRLWDTQSYQCLHIFKGHTGSVWSLSFSPDGQFFASSSQDSTIRIWSIHNRLCLHVFQGETNQGSVVFSADGKFLISGGSSNRDGSNCNALIRLWDIRKKKLIHTFEGHLHRVLSVAVSADGQWLASSGEDSTIRLWDIKKRQFFHMFEEHENQVWSLAFSPNGKFLVSGSSDSTVRLWDISKKQCIHVFNDHANWVETVAFSAEGSIIASGSNDGTIRLWNAQMGNCLSVLQVPRPYEGTNITGAGGLTKVQRASLLALGAVDYSSSSP